ncbi:peptide ABC transporter substrate-binding protein [Acetobacteraceae bacterium H6797]|nr:peptide ABC transporter substrate-binding protein [Acetobacteraceae bacterium H6797]
MTTTFSRRGLLGAAAALPAAGSLFANRRAMAQAAGGTLRFGLSAFPPSLRSWPSTGASAGTVKLNIFRGLLGNDAKGELRGELAESWRQVDPVTYEFKLRQNAVFQDGAKVDPDAIRFNVEAIAAEKSTAYQRAVFQNVAKVEAPDASTVRLVLKEPNATFLLALATYNSGFISPKSTEADPIGAGPYRLVGQERGSRIEVEAFDKFYKPGLPKTKKIVFQVYQDESLRATALRTGDVDIIEYVPWAQMDQIESDPNQKLLVSDGGYMCLLFNCARGPFADKRVRQAVAWAVRRDDIVKAAFFGRGHALNGIPFRTTAAMNDPSLNEGWGLDLNKAKALLAAAGVGSGFQAKLLSTAQFGMHKDTAEVVQQSLAAIGIQCELNMPEWGTRVQLGNRGQYDLAVHGLAGDYNDPDSMTNYLLGGQPASYSRPVGFNNEKANQLMKAGQAESDPQKRLAIYRELRDVLLDEAAFVGLAWRSQGYGTRSNISGFANLPGFLSLSSGSVLEDVVVG